MLLEMQVGVEPRGAPYVYSILASSLDGLNWENVYYSEPYPGEAELTMLGYEKGRWMAMGIDMAYTSTDGVNWEESSRRRNAVPKLRNARLATGGGEWWAIKEEDEYVFSPDGLDWSAEVRDLKTIVGAAALWAVGEEGLRNLFLDAEGRVRARALSELTGRSGPLPIEGLAESLPTWPPSEADEWDETTVRRYRELFDRHVAFSRDLHAFRSSWGVDAQPTSEEWAVLLDKHLSLLQDPDLGALKQIYGQSARSMSLLYTVDDNPDSATWQVHMRELKQSLAAVAIYPDLWFFRARMHQWSGELDEARKDAKVAELLLGLSVVKDDAFYELERQKVAALNLELNLPLQVLDVPQEGVAPYNLSVAKRNAFLGKNEDDDRELVLKIYRNFGKRLSAVWRLTDTGDNRRIEADLFRVHASYLNGLNFPKEDFASWEKKVDQIWKRRALDRQQALSELDAVLAEIPHPYFLSRRALLLNELDRRTEAIQVLGNVLTVWPGYEFAKQRLVKLREEEVRVAEAWMEARYQEAVDKLNRGDLSGGCQILQELSEEKRPSVDVLLLWAELQNGQCGKELPETILRRAHALYPDSPQVAASLGLFLVGQRKTAEARAMIDALLSRDERNASLQAVAAMAEVMESMTRGTNAPMVVREVNERIGRLKFQPGAGALVFAVSTQLNLLLENQELAVADMARMAELKPYVPPELWFQIGQLYRNLNMNERAKIYLKKAEERGLSQAKEMLDRM